MSIGTTPVRISGNMWTLVKEYIKYLAPELVIWGEITWILHILPCEIHRKIFSSTYLVSPLTKMLLLFLVTDASNNISSPCCHNCSLPSVYHPRDSVPYPWLNWLNLSNIWPRCVCLIKCTLQNLILLHKFKN